MKCSYVKRCEQPEDCELHGYEVRLEDLPDRPATCGEALAMIRELEAEHDDRQP